MMMSSQMARLDEVTPGSLVNGILPDAATELISAKWHGSDVVEVVYKDSAGRVGTELLFREKEPSLHIVTTSSPYSFDGDGKLFRLVSEAHRIRLAHLFSLVGPLPHRLSCSRTRDTTRS
jgi:hypothetical protein